MEKQKSRREKEEVDEIVDTLIDMPVKSLEERIKRLEAEMTMRGVIFKGTQESLGTRRLRLEEDIERHWYSAVIGLDRGRRSAMEQRLIQTQNKEMDEWLAYLRDMAQLKEKLQNAGEDLALEKQKRRLVG